MPDFLTPKQEKLRQAARALGKHLAELSSASDDPNDLRTKISDASKAAGIFSLTQPKDHGGKGGSSTDLVIVRDALGSFNAGHLPGIFGPSPGLLGQASQEVKEKFLVPFLNGQIHGGFGFTEPSDAIRHTWGCYDGSNLVVNGAKSYVTGGLEADFINTLVEVEGEGPAMVLIESRSPGVEIAESFNSVDGSHHAHFTFCDVRVPSGHIIGKAGTGLKRALDQINAVRMAIAANCVGLNQFVCDLLAESLAVGNASETRERVHFGRMRTMAFAARSSLYRTAGLLDSGQNSVNEVMISKALATETLNDLVDQAIQIVGGEALVESHPLAQIFKRARSTRLAEGPTEVLYANISSGLLDLNLGKI